MDFITLNCPNCNGQIEHKEGQTFKCPSCGSELMLKKNNVYFVDQTINNYYGTTPAATTKSPNRNVKLLLIVPFMLIGIFFSYYLLNSNSVDDKSKKKIAVRTLPESEVVLFFLKDIFNKGEAMPTEEELATIRYLSTRYYDDQWHFTYSLDDPFTNKQAEMIDYVVMDKLLNTQKIEQKDFEAFSGLTTLHLNNEYEISQSEKVSFRHLQGLKSYTGAFNESFGQFAHYFGDKANIVELSTQIRSNEELALLLEFPNLQSLEISYVNETVTDFHLLSQLPLKSLSLSTINDLKWLSALTGLQSLTVTYSEATDFSALYSLSQLQDLKLSMVQNLKVLDFIQNMPNLQSLDLESVNITNIERLRDKLSLTKLRLSSLYQLESIDVVNSLTSLTELEVTSYTGAVPAILSPNLKKATVTGSVLPKLEAPALQSLTVYIRGVTDNLDGAQLLRFPKLEQLTAFEYGGFVGISALNRLPNLQTLHLFETIFYDEANALFKLQHVKTLNCNECTFQIKSQNPIVNNTLEHVTLNRSSFIVGNGDRVHEMDKVMPYFSKFTALRSFTMQEGSIQSLDFMKNWKQVEVLRLENNAISNVEPLVNLPNLRKLYVVGNPVQNKSVLDKEILIY
ncbi:leucine-rich repeat domain-containing protein [Paenibacillus yanchengensis]|uniref:Leucine-rich repeat domain-containing protein n=1 Tax=Paenibacillus yanchengensis TaxID=2035833 RepID=A0ABW4YPC6_9BACL